MSDEREKMRIGGFWVRIRVELHDDHGQMSCELGQHLVVGTG